MEQKLRQVLSQDQAKLLKYWIGKCQADSLPQRRAVSPADLIFCLPNISIVEHQTSGEFTFRLTASSLKDILGEECRGRLVSQECGKEIPWCEALKRCQSTKAPVFGSTPIGHRRTHSWMRLPLQPTDDGRQPVLCYDRIGFDDHDDGPRRETMFVTADLIRRSQLFHQSAA
ncbi:MAG: hypothetical protein CMK09_00520 [Ponticaulis sp.]|nr:hypothetical protein [Ponticaulis sp.]